MASDFLVSALLILVIHVGSIELKEAESNDKNESVSKSPNIVFILVDDMGWNDVSFHGSDQIPTPNIDALAYNGVVLNNHYVLPICTPTRSALLTGKYPIHTGMQGMPLFPAERRGLPLKEKTIAQHLKKLGYSTHIVGKWHVGFYQTEFTPLRRGFDSHIGYYNAFTSYYDHMMDVEGPYGYFTGYDFRKNYTTAWEYQGKYATDIFTEEAENVIKRHNKEKPLFLYLAHVGVHTGNDGKKLEAPQEFIDKFRHIPDPNRRTYAAMVSKLDESVGRVVSALQEKDMLTNSIVVFLSDNGAPLTGGSKNWGSNEPFRGEKITLWEGGVRTPAAIWSPLIRKSSRVSKQLMHVTDWLPTLYSAAGGKKEDLSKDLDGLNLWPTISQNKPSPRKEVVINIYSTNYGAVLARKKHGRSGKLGTFKIIIGKTDYQYNYYKKLRNTDLAKPYNPELVLSSPANGAIRKAVKKHINSEIILSLRQKSKLTCAPAANVSDCTDKCLFDLENDPCEQIDLSASHTKIMSYMQNLYDTMLNTAVPELSSYMDPAANPAFFNYTWSPWVPSTVHNLKLEFQSIEKSL